MNVVIHIPAAATQGHFRRPTFISSNTKSASVAVNGAAPVAFDLVSGAPGCTTDSSGVTCTISITAPIGNDTFDLKLFDGLQATGNVLSHAAVTQTIVLGQPNVVPMTLHGIVASVVLSLGGGTFARGTSTTVPLTVNVKDASGATIVGDPFEIPIVLSDSDTSGATSLSRRTVSSPADAVTLTYTGAVLRNATIGVASLPSSAANTVKVTPHTGSTTDWATYGFDTQRAGENPNETRVGTGNAASLQQLWSFQANSLYLTTQPVVAADIFISTLAGGAYADVLIVGDEHGNVYALDALDGTLLWQRALGRKLTACSDIPDMVYGVTGTATLDRPRSRAYVVDGLGALHALDLATGADATGYPAALGLDPVVDHVYSSPLYDAATGRIFIPSASYCDYGVYHGRLLAVNAAAGTLSGAFQTIPTDPTNYGGGIWSPGGPSLDPRGNGRIYVATGNAIPNEGVNYSDGVLWLDESTLSPHDFNQPMLPVVGDDFDFGTTPAIFSPPGCPSMFALQQKTGVLHLYGLDTMAAGPLQSLDLAGDHLIGIPMGTPAYSSHNSMLFMALATDGPTTGIQVKTGIAGFTLSGCRLSLAWNQPYGTPGVPASNAVVANGVVYAGTGIDKHLKAWNAVTGAPLFDAALGASIFASPTVVNGRVFAATWDGHVYAYGLPGDKTSALRRSR